MPRSVTGVTGSSVAHTPAAIHNELLKENPTYCHLQITQLPTWVWRPDLYGPGSSLSLMFAFKDPDGSLLTLLLASRFFFLFGVQSTLRKWINRHSTPAKLHVAWRKMGLLKSQTEHDSHLAQKDKEDKIVSDHGIVCPVTPVTSGSSSMSGPLSQSPPTPALQLPSRRHMVNAMHEAQCHNIMPHLPPPLPHTRTPIIATYANPDAS